MTVIYPEATPVQGNTKYAVVLTIATPTAPDLSAEISAATTLDISCYIRDFNPEVQSNTGFAPARACTTVQLPVEGLTQFSPIELRYVYDPQAADATDENKLKTLLTRGTEFFMVVRKGLDARTDNFSVGDYVEVWKFRAGRQNRGRSGTDEFGEYEIVQNLFPLTEAEYGQIVA